MSLHFDQFGPSPQGIRAGVVLIDGFGPVYLGRMEGGAAAPGVCGLDVSSLKLAADAPSVGGPFSIEWWEA